MHYNTNLDKLEKLCKIVSKGLKKKSDGYDSDAPFSKSAFYRTVDLAKGLGFVAEDGLHALSLTSRGEKFLSSEEGRKSALEKGIQNDEIYSKLWKNLQSKGSSREGRYLIDKSIIESEIRSIDPSISDNTATSARRLFLQLINETDMADIVKRGREKYIELNSDRSSSFESAKKGDASSSVKNEEASTEDDREPMIQGEGYRVYYNGENDAEIMIDSDKFSEMSVSKLMEFVKDIEKL